MTKISELCTTEQVAGFLAVIEAIRTQLVAAGGEPIDLTDADVPPKQTAMKTRRLAPNDTPTSTPHQAAEVIDHVLRQHTKLVEVDNPDVRPADANDARFVTTGPELVISVNKQLGFVVWAENWWTYVDAVTGKPIAAG